VPAACGLCWPATAAICGSQEDSACGMLPLPTCWHRLPLVLQQAATCTLHVQACHQQLYDMDAVCLRQAACAL